MTHLGVRQRVLGDGAAEWDGVHAQVAVHPGAQRHPATGYGAGADVEEASGIGRSSGACEVGRGLQHSSRIHEVVAVAAAGDGEERVVAASPDVRHLVDGGSQVGGGAAGPGVAVLGHHHL